MKQKRTSKFSQRDELMTNDFQTMTLAEIGKKYHMTYQNAHLRIRKVMEMKGLDFTDLVKYRRMHPRVPHPTFSFKEAKERRIIIIRAYKRGASVKKIASKYNLSPTSIYEKLHRYNVM